jgi:hypothetical protein
MGRSGEARKAEAARQSPVGHRLDNVGRDEGERQGHPRGSRSHVFAL